jgi:nitroreductase
MQLETAVKKRRSIRNFSDRKADWRKILLALDYARFAPMAGNYYSLKYILVSDREKIRIIEGACQQKFVGKADYLLVVLSDRDRVKKMYDSYCKEFGAQQAGAAIQNILLGLTEQGLASCWVGFFENSIIARELKIPNSLVIEAVVSIGVEGKFIREKQKPKPELDNLLFFERFGMKHMGEDTKQKYDAS